MHASSRTPKRGCRVRVTAVVASALLLVLSACSDETAPRRPAADPTAESTPLADYTSSDLTLVRGEFCDRITEGAIAAALGDDPTDEQDWQPGTRLPGSRDISNEFGCSWGSGPVSAGAWVFAPPVTRHRAADLVREIVGKGCERLETAPDLGAPSVAQHCGKGTDLTSFHGLVGDAWIGCEINGLPVAGGDDTARVGEWCVAVLEALRAE